MSIDLRGDQQMVLQKKDFGNNKIMKHQKGNQIFCHDYNNNLYEYFLNKERMDLIKIFNGITIATPINNKYMIVKNIGGGFKEINIRTHKHVNNFGLEKACQFVVTYNNKFLFTILYGTNVKFTKYSIQTKQPLHTWDSDVNHKVESMTCSWDSKY